MSGRFITVEGPEGAGKTTLVTALADRLRRSGIDVLATREPGDGPSGPAIRDALLQGGELDAWTESFLFLADRRQHCEHVIRPALESGRWVLCDRFADSTVVYQGYGRGLDVAELRGLNELATSALTPDLTLLLDLPPEVGLSRLRGGNLDRLDRESPDFHRRVREGYLAEAALSASRWRIIAASGSPAETLEAAWQAVTKLRADALL